MTISGTNDLTNPWLRRFAKWTCFSTLILIFIGAMVKSTGSGLAVPDWPLSYGMWFPPMVGGVFYEHGHRMAAAAVGFFMLCLAIWLGVGEKRLWVRNLGFCSLGIVMVQGVLGGLTVLFFLPTWISMLHGILAQTFFLLTILIAYSLSIERREREQDPVDVRKNFLKLVVVWIGFIFLQLFLGALMRHTESGLAIPDFPKMGGYWIPPFNDAMLTRINVWRFENNFDYVTKVQIIYHFLHRLGAFVIVAFLCTVNIFGFKEFRMNKPIVRTLFWLDFLVIVQIFLGIMTVLTLKAPRLTSLHVMTGAAILGVSFLLFLRVAPVSLKYCKQQLFN